MRHNLTEEVEPDTDGQLKKVEEFVIDLTKISNEIYREGFTHYSPPSTTFWISFSYTLYILMDANRCLGFTFNYFVLVFVLYVQMQLIKIE